jgi:uncharacterized membrane protein YcaP (DUF421 family)
MNAVLRAAIVYGVLLLFFRLSGKRTLAQVTTFDALLLLIFSEAVQQALLAENDSLTAAGLIILTFLALEIILSELSSRFPRLSKVLSGVPLLLVDKGEVLTARMKQARVGEDDLLSAARRLQGLERLDQVKYAVMETDGSITIIPWN